MHRALLLTIAFALALPASAVHAAPVAPTAPPLIAVPKAPTAATAASAAWQSADGTHVLRDDQPLGGEAVLHPPAGCRLGGLTATDVAYACPTESPDFLRVWLQDRGTTALRSNAIGFLNSGAGGEAYELSGIGAALGTIYTTGGAHVDEQTEYRRLSDGRTVRPKPSAHRALSLDAASGTVKLCAPLAVGTHVVSGYDDFDRAPYRYTAYDASYYRAPWLVTIRRGRVLLKRCGTRTVRDLGVISSAPGDLRLVLTRRYVAWMADYSSSTLTIHRFADHATFRSTTTLGPYARTLTATDRRLWIGDGQGKAYMIEP
ncbi:hypothetical protein [Baekduia sp. Peel2402]|uniref:hypothetical protein n=1 Tax=Baekduia sp. Peel2402 TaxID=3458296 RepID=UPI00403E8BE2